MRAWIRSRVRVPCGSCRCEIRVGDPLLEIVNAGIRLCRCAGCGVRLFGEPPPSEWPEETPQPVAFQRRPDFVTSRSLARSYDARQRQTGDE